MGPATHMFGTGEVSVGMRALSPPPCMCDNALAKLSHPAVWGLLGYVNGYGIGHNGGSLPLANNFLQSTDKIMTVSQKL